MRFRLPIIAGLMLIMVGCAEIETKQNAFPKMYSAPEKPLSILVLPAINKSTAADAGDLLNSTLTIPFADNGYYIMPISIVSDIFNREGIVNGAQLADLPSSIFRNNFGADAVLYVTINKWDTSYLVIAANVSVGMSYVLVSTSSNEVLWSYDQTIVVDTAGDSSGVILLDVIKTAVNTAMTDYIPIARRVNDAAVMTMPYGHYHPDVGKDGNAKVVSKKARESALNQ